MLSKEDNEILCRVGPGTLMGNLLRRYWMPALLSNELPSPDCPPAEKVLEPDEDWRRLGTDADPVVLAATVGR